MPKKLVSIISWALAALFASVILMGCNLAPPPEKVESPQLKPRVPIAKVKIAEPPAGWPEEIPFYPEAELDDVTSTGSAQAIVLKTPDTAAQVFAWYYDELEKRDWKMLGPTLDVAQNVAIIEGELGDIKMYLEARSVENDDGTTGGLAIKITSGL